jgi:hypothetical protein
VDANEAFTTMLCKWILKFVDPSDYKVQIVFKYHWSKVFLSIHKNLVQGYLLK